MNSMTLLNLPISKYLIIGSYALGIRLAKDIDVICYKQDIQVETTKGDDYVCSFEYKGRKIECLLADKQESLQVMLEVLENSSYGNIANYDILFALKAGHIIYPHRQFEKHMLDFSILKQLVADKDQYNHYYIDYLTKLHRKSTEERIGKQRLPKLIGVSKEQFFDDNVKKYVEHDSIHYMVAHKEHPMYWYMQHDHSKVECHKELWDNFTFEDKIHCVMEECYVIALERHIIPTIKGDRIGLNYHEAFKWALMRVCTTLTSGWFRLFAIDHYFNVLNNYNKEYYKLLKLSDGTLAKKNIREENKEI
jgi:hypothetical protein